MKGDITKIYGVNLVGSKDPDALVRTDDAAGLNVTVGISEITSDFDSCYPWSDIEEVTDEFGNVFIKIPKFYSQITGNADGTYLHQLSGTKREGFDTLFKIGEQEIDYILVGKYEGSGSPSRVYSKSGADVLTDITLDDFRMGCRANGEGYQQYDFLIDLIIKELWLVEMKTTNSQSIMVGYTNGDKAIVTGETDTVSTPSGSPESNTDGKHAMKYRGIENLWGNVYAWCDGISFSSEKVYVCTAPAYYTAGKTASPYIYQGNRATSSDYIKTVKPLGQNPLIQYATEVYSTGGGYDEAIHYFCDRLGTGGPALMVGGDWLDKSWSGLWRWDDSVSTSGTGSSVGGRLCYKSITLPSAFNPQRNKMVCSIGRLSDISSTQKVCYGLEQFKLPSPKQEAFCLQPKSWTDSETGDLTSDGHAEFEYLNHPHPFDALTGEELVKYNNIHESVNTQKQRLIGECCLQPIKGPDWQQQTWNGLSAFEGENIWTDGENIYYSGRDRQQYQLDPYTSLWTHKDWQGALEGDRSDEGRDIWSDGKNIYYSDYSSQYELISNTSTWKPKEWKVRPEYLTGRQIWTDGKQVYYSEQDEQWQLDGDTWTTKQWLGSFEGLTGQDIWTDGENIYYSNRDKQYRLDKSTSTWFTQTWNENTPDVGRDVWADGVNIYYSDGEEQYQLDRTTSTWNVKNWSGLPKLDSGLTKFEGNNVWSAAGYIYYSSGALQYKLFTPQKKQYNVWTDLKRIQINTPAGPRVVQTKEAAVWRDITADNKPQYWVEGWDKNADTHMVQVKRHPQLTNKILNIDCYMQNIDDLYTAWETCILSYEGGTDFGTWCLKKPDGSTYITLKVKQTHKQEGEQ